MFLLFFFLLSASINRLTRKKYNKRIIIKKNKCCNENVFFFQITIHLFVELSILAMVVSINFTLQLSIYISATTHRRTEQFFVVVVAGFGICMQQCCSSSNTLMFLNEGHIWNAGQCTTTFCPAISCHFYLWTFMNIQLGHRNEQKMTIIFFSR